MEHLQKSDVKKIFLECLDEVLPKICGELELREIRCKFSKKLRGNKLAAELLGVSPNALTQRVAKGVYLDGVHFKKISDRIYIWDREALLKERDKK